MDTPEVIAWVDDCVARLVSLWAQYPSVETPEARALLPVLVELHAARKRLVRLNITTTDRPRPGAPAR